MMINTGKFSNPKAHHNGRFRVFRFDGSVEIWIGSRWIIFSKP